MHPETEKLVRLALLWHLLYCSGLEPNLDISEVSLWISTWVLVGTNPIQAIAGSQAFPRDAREEAAAGTQTRHLQEVFVQGYAGEEGRQPGGFSEGGRGTASHKLHGDPAGSVQHPSRVSMSVRFPSPLERRGRSCFSGFPMSNILSDTSCWVLISPHY